jgi:APA family basic amino acid/polyamine antiporter
MRPATTSWRRGYNARPMSTDPALPPEASPPAPTLVRGLGLLDGTLLTIGSVLGTGIFLTTSDMARVLPHPGLILLAWVVGGLLSLAGALTYAELGALYPRAGGPYHFLREAFGPLPAFLLGWACFLVIMSGGVAAIAVGFAEYLGAFVPALSTRRVLAEIPLGGGTWRLSAGQLTAAATIFGLSAVNYVGLRAGAGLQSAVTAAKVAAIVLLGVLGLLAPAPQAVTLGGPLPSGSLLSAFGVAMVAVLWTFDGWYGATFMAGEMRRPERNLPWSLLLGTLAVMVMYLLLNVVYLRALPVAAIAEQGRIGEAAAATLFGPWAARLVTMAVLVSSFGCLSSTILYSARIYLPMAEDGLFFRRLARVHPRFRTPAACIAAQAAWAAFLTLSGSYEQLYTYVVFTIFGFHAAVGAALLALRRKKPDTVRPYRVWGYPWVPLLFVVSSVVLVLNTLVEKPVESAFGLGLVAIGLPAYAWWRRHAPGV